MYKHFFGLREDPFNVNPDPRYLFLTSQTHEALDTLTHGIRTRKGLILLTGEVGTGKTTLINHVLAWLHQQRVPTAFIFNSRLEARYLFDFMLMEFGVPFDPQIESSALLRLNEWLLEHYHAGDKPVLIVDEAQGLTFDLLEEIRLLLNLETPREKLLQVVLAGQPELEEKLTRPELRQLRQRITLWCKTAPLTCEETQGYIRERLRIAGAANQPIFELAAMDAAYRYSGGIPRVLNLLCEHALINAYADNVRPVPAYCVEEAAREFVPEEVAPNPRGAHPAAVRRDLLSPPKTSGPVIVPLDSQFKDQFVQQTADYAAPASSVPHLVSPKSAFHRLEAASGEQSPAYSAVAAPVSSSSRIGRSRFSSMPMLNWNRALDLWWSNNFSQPLCWKIFVSAGLAGCILFVLGLQMSVPGPGSHFASVICGCLGLLLCAVSLGCGASLLIYSTNPGQSQIMVKWSRLFASFLRWLRQPI